MKADMKVVMLGCEVVGKTSLVQRFIHDRFIGKLTYQATIGAAFGSKTIEIDGKSLTLGLWDTAGSERYISMSSIYYRDADAAIVCYDLTNADSFDRVRFWVQELNNNEQNCKVYLCATKKDLVRGDNKHRRKIDMYTVNDYAFEIKADVFETSSKSGENVQELFKKIALDKLEQIKTNPPKEEDPSKIQLSSNNKSKFKCCFL